MVFLPDLNIQIFIPRDGLDQLPIRSVQTVTDLLTAPRTVTMTVSHS